MAAEVAATEVSERRPLLILPLPSDPELTAIVLRAAGDWWRMRHGEELVLRFGPRATGPLRQEEDTPYGRALVLRESAKGGEGSA